MEALPANIGIDYGVLSGGIEQYWMYFSKERIPKKYFHNITRRFIIRVICQKHQYIKRSLWQFQFPAECLAGCTVRQ